MKKYAKIVRQKLIIKHEQGALFYFVDESVNEDGCNCSAYVDLFSLVYSCFCSFSWVNGSGGVLTCTCGMGDCVGFGPYSYEIKGEVIYWDITRYGKNVLFKFDRHQYIEEVKAVLERLKQLFSEQKRLEYVGSDKGLTAKYFAKLYLPFSEGPDHKEQGIVKQKIILCPTGRYIYEDENGKRVSFNKKDELLWTYVNLYERKLVMALLGFSSDKGTKELKRKFKSWIKRRKDKNVNWEEWNREGLGFARNMINRIFTGKVELWYRYQGDSNYKKAGKMVRIKRKPVKQYWE